MIISLRRLLVLAAACLASTYGLQGHAEDRYQSVVDDLHREIVKEMRHQRIAGTAVALIDDQRIFWSQGYGEANARNRTKLTARTPMQVGDVTKLVTTIATLQAVEEGKFELDTPISELLDDVAIRSRHVGLRTPTVRDLLTHHSGLSGNILAGSYMLTPNAKIPRWKDIFLAQPTGQIYAYSNLGFSVMGQILEETYQTSYQDLVTDKILKPLGMESAQFGLTDDIAIGHKRRGRPQEPLYSRDVAALGLHASVEDVAKLVRWMFRERTDAVLGRQFVDEMFTVQNQNIRLDLDNKTGLAWQLTNTGGHPVDRVARMNSGTQQFRGVLLAAPDEKLAVVIFSNSGNATDFVIDTSVDALNALIKAKTGRDSLPLEKRTPNQVPLPEAATSDTLRPAYATALGLIEFESADAVSDMDFLGRGFRASRRADGWYTIAYRLLGLVDLRISILQDLLVRPVVIEGRHVLLAFYGGSTFLFGERLTLPNGSEESKWEFLEGEYELENPDPLSEQLEIDEIEIEIDHGIPVAEYTLPFTVPLYPRVPLIPAEQNLFIVPGLGTNMGDEVIMHRDGQGISLYYLGYRFRRDD